MSGQSHTPAALPPGMHVNRPRRVEGKN